MQARSIWLMMLSALIAPILGQDQAAFRRAINLNGPPLTIDGRSWEGKEAKNLAIHGNAFENQTVPLKPETDPERARMIRSSIWAGDVDVALTGLAVGAYQVVLYIWEDNNNEQFDILVNDQVVVKNFQSGTAGEWKKLGPWRASPNNGIIRISGRGGAANFSGVELWSGDGPVPNSGQPEFANEITEDQLAFFEKRVRPVLVEQCYECHSAGAKKVGGGLLLDSRPAIVKGGHSGPVILPGSPVGSLLIKAVKHLDPDLTMPPKKKIAPEEIDDLEKWVAMRAPDPRTEDTVAAIQRKSAIDWDRAREFWSFRPISQPEVPAVKKKDWPRSPIDHFILAKLEAAELSTVHDANKTALIRRATYDLTGLPPTPEEIERFLADQSSDAFDKAVERLLASPRYGERWGRHWLDVVRYADTAGDNSDFPIPQIHRYRDWVIGAFNRDLPYDQFVREQLAGDLLGSITTEEAHQRIIATGYIANARRFGSRVSDYPQHLTIEDTIDNLGRAFLGLSISCARCHDHKFDPIPTEDYYALYGVFQSTRYPWPGIELDQKQRDLVPLVPPSEVESVLKARSVRQKELDDVVAEWQKKVKTAEGEEKKAVQKTLDEAKKAAETHQKTALPFPQAYAVAEAKKIENAAVQQKGDPAKPGPVVKRGFLRLLQGGKFPVPEKSSGRLELAEWLLSKENPLPARVMANRIWHYHFGRGLAPTPNDFGKQGKPPTHPELLDWLASRFVESGWSIKALHREIMRSRTYQLASGLSSEALARDPANQWLSAFPRRRLDAESIRDTFLFLGGNLDLTSAPPHPFPPQTEWKFTQHNPFKAVYTSHRRSVYLMTQRIARHPFLAIFDGPDPAASTAARLSTTTPIQALYLLNDPFVHEQSKLFTSRFCSEAEGDEARWKRAFLLAMGRMPDTVETAQAIDYLGRFRSKYDETPSKETADFEAWQAISRSIFRMNEFIYID